MADSNEKHFYANQVNEGPDGLKSGDPIEYRGSFTSDGETEYGRWNAGEVGAVVDWGFLVTGRGVAIGIARKWEDEGKTWRRPLDVQVATLQRQRDQLLAALKTDHQGIMQMQGVNGIAHRPSWCQVCQLIAKYEVRRGDFLVFLVNERMRADLPPYSRPSHPKSDTKEKR